VQIETGSGNAQACAALTSATSVRARGLAFIAIANEKGGETTVT
jgi:hypothetical protein